MERIQSLNGTQWHAVSSVEGQLSEREPRHLLHSWIWGSGTMRITCVNQTIKKLQKARSESYSCIYICQSKAFETLFCIFVPWIWIRTGRAQRLYTLSTHSVLKYLYNPKLLILTPHHFSIQEKECTRKAGAKRENKISEKSFFCSMIIVSL